MIKAHKIQLNPTKAQKVFFVKSSGVARFSYNWALSKWKELYEKGEKPSAYSLIKLQNSIKKLEFAWMKEVTKCAPQYAIHDLESAYKKMWKEGFGYPKFKKKGVKDSFVAVENKVSFKQKDFKIWIPRLGWVKCHENFRFEGKVNNVVVKRIADKWFAVINIDTLVEAPIMSENQAVIGVDMGISKMMVVSDGTFYENPKALKSNLKGLKRCQRSLIRKVKGSNNRKKQQTLLARKHYKISCIRSNAIHQATTDLVKRAKTIVIEDLNVRSMVRNRNLSQSLSDVSFGEIKRQLIYKCKWYGVELVLADRFYPSSKICSNCGRKKEKLKLSDRIYHCENCKVSIDRDLNAAKNLASLGTTHNSGGSQACGADANISISYSVAEKHEIDCLNNLIN